MLSLDPMFIHISEHFISFVIMCRLLLLFLFFGWVVFSMGHWDKAMMMNTQCNLDS